MVTVFNRRLKYPVQRGREGKEGGSVVGPPSSAMSAAATSTTPALRRAAAVNDLAKKPAILAYFDTRSDPIGTV